MMYPKDYYFTKDHEWVKVEGDKAVVGITDFAQKQLGDVVYVELPEVGRRLDVHQAIGVIESVKAVSDVYSPVSGEVLEVNEALNASPNSSTKTRMRRDGSSASSPPTKLKRIS